MIRHTLIWVCACTLLIGVLTSAGWATATGYAFTDLYAIGTPAGLQDPASLYVTSTGSAGELTGDGYALPFLPGPHQHAVMWSVSAPNGIDLHPSGYTDSQAQGAGGSQQVGWAYGPTTGDDLHALAWTGSAASAVDLHPAGFDWSGANATDGAHQVGSGGVSPGSDAHALLWSGSAGSVVDLNPVGFKQSLAFGVGGSQQVGQGYGPATGNENHALVWSGSAASVVDLGLPTGYTSARPAGAGGGQQVGYGATTDGDTHAMLWSGTAASFVDLNPAGFTETNASGTNGALQVGYGDGTSTGGRFHALVWSGTAASAVDLASVLPATYVSSFAVSIYGNTIYGYAGNIQDNKVHAIKWFVTPEPGSLGLAGFAIAVVFMWRHVARIKKLPPGRANLPSPPAAGAFALGL